jgi:hypothetical protein
LQKVLSRSIGGVAVASSFLADLPGIRHWRARAAERRHIDEQARNLRVVLVGLSMFARNSDGGYSATAHVGAHHDTHETRAVLGRAGWPSRKFMIYPGPVAEVMAEILDVLRQHPQPTGRPIGELAAETQLGLHDPLLAAARDTPRLRAVLARPGSRDHGADIDRGLRAGMRLLARLLDASPEPTGRPLVEILGLKKSPLSAMPRGKRLPASASLAAG